MQSFIMGVNSSDFTSNSRESLWGEDHVNPSKYVHAVYFFYNWALHPTSLCHCCDNFCTCVLERSTTVLRGRWPGNAGGAFKNGISNPKYMLLVCIFLLSARDRSPLLAINLCWRALLVTRSMMDLYVFVLATGIWKWSSQKPCSSLHPVTAPRNAKTSKDQTHAFGTVLWMRMQCLGQNVSWIIPMWSVHACCVHIMWNHVGKGRSFHHTWKGSTVQGWCCVPYPLLRYIPESTSPS